MYAKQGEEKKAIACFAKAYRFARNQDAARRFLEELAHPESQDAPVRDAARKVLRLRLVQAQNRVPQAN